MPYTPHNDLTSAWKDNEQQHVGGYVYVHDGEVHGQDMK